MPSHASRLCSSSRFFVCCARPGQAGPGLVGGASYDDNDAAGEQQEIDQEGDQQQRPCARETFISRGAWKGEG